jgi:hypothetical protein
MDERRSTSPSITRVAEPTEPVAVDVAVQAVVDEVVPEVRVAQVDVAELLELQLPALQFLRFPQPGKAQLLLQLLQLLPQVRLPRAVEAVAAALRVVAVLVVALRVVEAVAVVVEVAVTQRPRVSPQFRPWRSSTCCWRPVSI